MGMGILLCSHFIFVRFSLFKHVGKNMFVGIFELLNEAKLASSVYDFPFIYLKKKSFILEVTVYEMSPYH